MRGTPAKPVAERLRSRTVRDENGCLVFTGYRDRKGYGQMGVGQRLHYVHRLAWESVHGPIPPGMMVCHRCDNPPCCEPTHLFLGTVTDNNADRDAKGRTFNGHAAKTHCIHGHPFDERNTYVYRDGRGRACKRCQRQRTRAYREALKQGSWGNPHDFPHSRPNGEGGASPVNR